MRAALSTQHSALSTGQSAVEFALVFPIVLAMLLGVIDLGRGMYANNLMAGASRQGARYLALNPSATDQQLFDATTGGLAGVSTDPVVLRVVADPALPSERLPGTRVTVTVSYDFHPVVPIGRVVGMLVGSAPGDPTGDYFLLRSSSASFVE